MIANIAVAFVIAVLGTNIAGYYSSSAPYLGVVLVAATALAAVSTFHHAATSLGFGLRLNLYSFAWLLLVSLPLMLMLWSDHDFDRSGWLSQIFTCVSFLLGLFAGGNKKLHLGLAAGALAVVFICAGLNLIEHFLYPDTWSTAPGRSAGWHVNPNISAAALTGYTILYMFTRPRDVRHFDAAVLFAAAAGTLVTFSRAGFVLVAAAAFANSLARLERRLAPGYVVRFGLLIIALIATVIIVLPSIIGSLNLSPDTSNRVAFLIGEGQKDQSFAGREEVAEIAWYEFNRYPLTGVGIRTSLDLPTGTGPHNMYAALAMDAGVFPLALYIGLIVFGAMRGLIAFLTVAVPESRILLPVCVWVGFYSFASHNILTGTPDLLVIASAVGISSTQSSRSAVRANLRRRST